MKLVDVPNLPRKFMEELSVFDLRLRLKTRTREQKKRFAKLAPQFVSNLSRFGNGQISDLMTDMWSTYVRQLEERLLPSPLYSFEQDPIVAGAMVYKPEHRLTEGELSVVEEVLVGQDVGKLLEEDSVGRPPLFRSSKYITSPNAIHHLYHVCRYRRATGKDLTNVGGVIEWGGGYGNMAKLFSRFSDFSGIYTVIDLPLLSCLQWLYLATVLGEEHVTLVVDPSKPAPHTRFVLVPVQFAKQIELRADFFLSTWAISESSVAAQDWVADEMEWFGARNLLLGFQDSSTALPAASRIDEKARLHGATIEALDLQPGNHYAFL